MKRMRAVRKKTQNMMRNMRMRIQQRNKAIVQ